MRPRGDVEIDVAQRVDRACGGHEVDREAAHLEQVAHRLPPQPRIEQVAERLAEKGEAERGQHQRHAAGDHRPGRLADDQVALVQDRAPGCGRRQDAEAEEAEASLDRHHHRHVHGAEDQERPGDVGQEWRSMIRQGVAPSERSAMMKSALLSASVLVRASRA